MILEELEQFVKFERVDSGAFCVTYEERANIARVKLYSDDWDYTSPGIDLNPKARQTEWCYGFSVGVICQDLT